MPFGKLADCQTFFLCGICLIFKAGKIIVNTAHKKSRTIGKFSKRHRMTMPHGIAIQRSSCELLVSVNEIIAARLGWTIPEVYVFKWAESL